MPFCLEMRERERREEEGTGNGNKRGRRRKNKERRGRGIEEGERKERGAIDLVCHEVDSGLITAYPSVPLVL